MDAITLLEKRIAALELQILPADKTCLSSDSQSITDLLLQTQTMIKSALSCREAITSILQHTLTINEYLDPNHGTNELEVEAKRHYLLELYPEIKETIRTVGSFEKLVPFVDSANISKVTELAEKMEHLGVANLSLYEQSREVTMKVLKSLQQYNDITMSIKMLFGQLDRAVSELEEALQPVFDTEE